MLPPVGQTAHANLVRNRFDRLSLEAGIQINSNRDVVTRAAFRMAYWGSNPRCVGNGVRIGSPASSGMPNGLRAGNAARTPAHREYQPQAIPFPAQWLDIAHVRINGVGGHDVGNRSGEDIGARLLQ